jgi:hypothetical protein
MDLALDDRAFLGRGLAVRTAGWFRGPRVVVDGVPVAGQKGRFLVRDNNGVDVEITLRSNYIDPIPKVTVSGHSIELARPLRWYEYTWIGLPILLALHGGLAGAICGYVAIGMSARVFRSENNTVLKFALTGLISAGTVIAFLVLGGALVTLIRSWFA